MQIAVCDKDEARLLETQSEIEACAQANKEKVVIQSFDSLPKLLFALDDVAGKIDLIYFDIETIGSLTGRELASKLSEHTCLAEVVFLAKQDQRWPEGYDAGAFHFLVRDKNYENKFEEVFFSVAKKISQKNKEVIVFSYAGDKVTVPIAEIQYFKSEGRMIHVFYSGNQEFEFYSRMNKIENILLKEGFERIHKSYLINRAYLVDVRGYTAYLDGGIELPVSRSLAPVLRESLAAKQRSVQQ